MKTIFLIGFMGSGKTSVGHYLAHKLELEMVDTDELIEQQNEISISEIFEQYGEKAFRQHEKETLRKLPTEDLVVSTGGGIVESNDNIDWMKNNGIVIYLDTSWEEIVQRLKNDTSRPLWNNQQLDKKKLFEKRKTKYLQAATFSVSTDNHSLDHITDEIIQHLT